MYVCVSATGVGQRSEEAASRKQQTEEGYRAAEGSAAGQTEETHRYAKLHPKRQHVHKKQPQETICV